MTKNTAILLVLSSFFACNTDKHEHGDHEAEQIEAPASKTGNFGEEISMDGALEVASILMENPGEEGVDVKVKGEILEVCQNMGCWVTLRLPNEKSVRVSTEEKFFLPKDISGYTAIVQGKLNKKVTSVADLRHFAEDGGKDEAYINSITEPKEEYTINAIGIMVLEEGS